MQSDGSWNVPAFNLPPSSFSSTEYRQYTARLFSGASASDQTNDLAARRRAVDVNFYAPILERVAGLYPCTSVKATIAGVPVETFEPRAGIADENRHRVLLNLHGGGFVFGGGGPGGAAESIPIAGLGRCKVISIDYRLAPEHPFPAANEDLANVYHELLETYRPESIGIYGCSAGGMITAAAIPWFNKHGLPLPAAVGIFCASTHRFAEGDSGQIWPRLQSARQTAPTLLAVDQFSPQEQVYFGTARPDDPLAIPAASADVLKCFPPTLFVTSSRAPEASGAMQSHLELLELGVHSQLLVLDGVEHGFIVYPIPEATRAQRLIVKFFMANLR